jgi:WD40 repeat protein
MLMKAHLPSDNDDHEVDSLPQFCPSRGWALLLDSIGQLHRYDTQTWQEVMPPIGHPLSESAYYLGFTVSSDGLHTATFDSPGENGPDGTLQIWNLKTMKPIGKPESGTNGISVTFLGDSRCLIRPSRGTARVVDLPSLKTKFEIRRHDDVEGSNVRVTSGKSGRYFLSWGYDQSLFLSHLADGTHAGNTVLPCLVRSVLNSDDPEHIWAVLDNSVFIGNPYYDFYVVKYSLPKMRPSATLRLQEFIHLASLSHDDLWLLVLEGRTGRECVRLFDSQTLVEHSFKTESR